MKSTSLLVLAVLSSVCWFNVGTAQTPLNNVKIGVKRENERVIRQCTTSREIDDWIAQEEARGLVIDSRPFAINQSRGKLLFTGKAARVSVVHMNPFVYDYKISVAQQELVSTALTDFLKLLLPQSLGSLPGLQSGEAGTPPLRTASDKLKLLRARLATFNRTTCNVDAASCDATAEMFRVFNEIQTSLNSQRDLDNFEINTSEGAKSADAEFGIYTAALARLRNEELETFDVCDRADKLNRRLDGYEFASYFRGLNTAQTEISRVVSLVEDLQQLTADYNKDTALKVVRCSGFNCTNQFLEYVNAVKAVLGGSQRNLDSLRQKGQEMQNMLEFTEHMKEKEGLFARTFTIAGKFELSQATIAVKRTKLVQEQANRASTQSGAVGSQANTGSPAANNPNAGSSEGTAGNTFGPGFSSDGTQNGSASGAASTGIVNPGIQSGNATPLVGEVNEVIQLGRPRFMLSGGMVYSPLPRRTFKKVQGFVLDAQGNPTGNGDANVVGFDQNSPRRLFPMVFLNSRLLDYERGSLYFSVGVTGKHDDNVDLEYLLGPSVSFLNDRALFTFGAYGGLTQNLVSDVKVGDAIPDSLGPDAKFYRKSLTWKPGFSVSYSFSRAKKRDVAASSGGTASAADDLKNEIRLGSIPFSFALGLAFTSLEQRTYDEIAGFARDRQGNLTNGQTLARIVGVTSSSNYRMTPLAMLHTRLTNFGAHDFYFTSGITGKKTDNDFDLEYLVGGSVNVYGRKVFLTFGTFIGKQQLLGGNFFEGQALGRSQSVTTQDRYVWKPAISLSYDISRIIPRPN